MGELALPPDKDRGETWVLAAKIVQSVVDDEAIPLPIHPFFVGVGLHEAFDKTDVEDLIFRLAYEIELLRNDLAAKRR